MTYINLLVAWVKARLAERSSWDGAMLIAVGVLILIASPFAKICSLFCNCIRCMDSLQKRKSEKII